MNLELNKELHEYYMRTILKEIFQDSFLSNILAFKGGTSLFFFHKLERFSVDLDFNLLDNTKEDLVFEKVLSILEKYGTIKDKAIKHYGSISVLNYGEGHHKLKVEISNREYFNHYEKKCFQGVNVTIMRAEDMFAHKLCALLDRKSIAGRDVFDCWHFLNEGVRINKDIVENRMGKSLVDYLNDCINAIHKLDVKVIMDGLGEVTDGEVKKFSRNRLKEETVSLLERFRDNPNIIDYNYKNDYSMSLGDLLKRVFDTEKDGTRLLELLLLIENTNIINKDICLTSLKNYLEKGFCNRVNCNLSKDNIYDYNVVNDIRNQYLSYRALGDDILLQKKAIEAIAETNVDSETKKVIIDNCNSIIQEIELKQKNIQYSLAYEKAEEARHVKVLLDKARNTCETTLSVLDSEIETIKDKLESLHEDQEESNTKSIRRRR